MQYWVLNSFRRQVSIKMIWVWILAVECLLNIYIKHMVSYRCKLIVEEKLSQLNIAYDSVDLGIVKLLREITPFEREALNTSLLSCGLELIEDKKMILVERIKNVIVDTIHHSDQPPKINYSHYITEKLGFSYNYLATTFRAAEGITIQQYIILHKIERIKELIFYGNMTFDQIAYKLHYSSGAHMSTQFKKSMGISPSEYKNSISPRKNIEDI